MIISTQVLFYEAKVAPELKIMGFLIRKKSVSYFLIINITLAD